MPLLFEEMKRYVRFGEADEAALRALRARPSDIPLLTSHFLERQARDDAKTIAGFTDEALERLVRYPWPGNVRELENAVERAVVVCRGERIEARDLGAAILSQSGTPDGAPRIPGASLAEVERYTILKTLEHTGGSTSRAAEILGISPRKIQYRLQEYQQGARRDGVADPE